MSTVCPVMPLFVTGYLWPFENALIFLPGSPVLGHPVSCSLSSLLSSIYCPFPGAALPSVTSHACLSVPGYYCFPSPVPRSRVTDPADSPGWRIQGHEVRQRGCQFRTSPSGSEHSSFVCQHPQIITICCLKCIK